MDTKWFGGNTLPANSPVSVAAGATLDLDGSSPAIGSLSDFSGSGGTVTNSASSASTLTVGNDGTSTTFSELISDAPATMALTKTGGGILTLAGANAYSGGTTISGGTLQVGNGGASGSLGTGGIANNAALAFNRGDPRSRSTP